MAYPSGGPKGALLHNDDSHGFTDPNQGGGPLPVGRNMSPHKRGGFGASGHRQPPGPRVGPGNAGGQIKQAGPVHGTPSHTRVPGHGGSPAKAGRVPFKSRGGFTHSGQKAVPTYSHANPSMRAGNTGGRSHRLIAGRFNRKAMGASKGANGPESNRTYGAPPVSTNT